MTRAQALFIQTYIFPFPPWLWDGLFVIDTSGGYTGKTFNFSQKVDESWGAGGGIEIPAADPLLITMDPESLTMAVGIPVDIWSATDAQGHDALLAYEGLPRDDNHKYDARKLLNQPARFLSDDRIVLAIPENSPDNTTLVGAAEVTVTATLDGPARSTPTVVDIDLSGTANRSDYRTAGPAGSIVIPRGSSAFSKKLVIVPARDDVTEGSETIVVNGTATGFTVTPATLTISDAPDTVAAVIDLAVDPASLDEDGSAVSVEVTATLGEGLATSSDTVVTISLGGTASASDYTATLRNVTIPAGKRSGSATLTITPADDSLKEDNETVIVRGSAGGFTVNPATITIVDWESLPTSTGITLSLTSYTVAEDSGGPGSEFARDFRITATMNGRPFTSDIEVWVTQSGTAEVGTSKDYTSALHSTSSVAAIRISAGERSGYNDTIYLQIIDDNRVEGDETIVYGGAAFISRPFTPTNLAVKPATLTIIDDDGPAASITLSVSPDRVDEDIPNTLSATDPEDDAPLIYRFNRAGNDLELEFASSTGRIRATDGSIFDYEKVERLERPGPGDIGKSVTYIAHNVYSVLLGVSDGQDAAGNLAPSECTVVIIRIREEAVSCDDVAAIQIYVINVLELLSPPGSLTATSTSSTSLQVEWQPPADNGGPPLTGYLLSHASRVSAGGSIVVNESSRSTVEISGTSTTSALITDLTPGQEYEVRLQAINSDGAGFPATAATTTLANSAPDSADFEIQVPLDASVAEFASSSFPFSDPDSDTHSRDRLHSVRIISAPTTRPCEESKPDGPTCGAHLSVGELVLDAGDVVPFADLDRLEMALENEWFRHSSFTFRVVDQYGGESPIYTASVVVDDPIVDSISIVSTPQGAGSIYHNGETIRVRVDFTEPLRYQGDINSRTHRPLSYPGH